MVDIIFRILPVPRGLFNFRKNLAEANDSPSQRLAEIEKRHAEELRAFDMEISRLKPAVSTINMYRQWYENNMSLLNQAQK